MCEPTTMFAVSTAFSALSAGVQYMQQSAAAEAEMDYQAELANQQNQFMVENAKAANSAYADQAHQQNLQVQQQQQAASEEIQANQREMIRRVGEATASSENAGSVVYDILRTGARGRDQIKTNLQFEQQQARVNLKGFQSEAQSRINSVRPYTPKPVARPSALAAAVSFGAGAFGAYNRHLGPRTTK